MWQKASCNKGPKLGALFQLARGLCNLAVDWNDSRRGCVWAVSFVYTPRQLGRMW